MKMTLSENAKVAERKMMAADGRIRDGSRSFCDLDELEARSIGARVAGHDVCLDPDYVDGVLFWLWSGVKAKSTFYVCECWPCRFKKWFGRVLR